MLTHDAAVSDTSSSPTAGARPEAGLNAAPWLCTECAAFYARPGSCSSCQEPLVDARDPSNQLIIASHDNPIIASRRRRVLAIATIASVALFPLAWAIDAWWLSDLPMYASTQARTVGFPIGVAAIWVGVLGATRYFDRHRPLDLLAYEIERRGFVDQAQGHATDAITIQPTMGAFELFRPMNALKITIILALAILPFVFDPMMELIMSGSRRQTVSVNGSGGKILVLYILGCAALVHFAFVKIEEALASRFD